ncbi:MAG: hypothetical protein QW261_14110 [Candidatus Jordarchaeaceae archaeon]
MAFSKTVYGAYYWKYWIEDVENDITIVSGNLNLPDSIYPDIVLAIDWDLSSYGDEIVSFDEYHEDYPIVFINKNALGELVYNKCLDVHDGWTEIDTIISFDRYISFFDSDLHDSEFDYRIVTVDAVACNYWACEISGPIWYLRFTEIDGDPDPELFADTFNGLLTFNIQSEIPFGNLSAPYPLGVPLDLDTDGIEECIIYFDYLSSYGWDRLLDSKTLNRIADVKSPSKIPLLIGYYQRDSQVVLMGMELTTTYPYTPNTVAIYSLRPNPTMTLLVSYMVLSSSQQTQQNQFTLMLLGGVAIAAIISTVIITLMRRRGAAPGPPEPSAPGEWKPT